jgi:hypothetical protein
MPHTPGHIDDGVAPNSQNRTQAQYRVYGTNEPYNGLTVKIGGYHYTTDEGTLQGDSLQLVPINNVSTQQQNQATTNPVTRTFVSRVVYYREDGSEVPIGSDLHEHQQGQIMLGHDPNNMGEIVTRNRPTSSNGNNRQMRTQTGTQTSTRRTGGTRNRTSGGGMSGGGGGY